MLLLFCSLLADVILYLKIQNTCILTKYNTLQKYNILFLGYFGVVFCHCNLSFMPIPKMCFPLSCRSWKEKEKKNSDGWQRWAWQTMFPFVVCHLRTFSLLISQEFSRRRWWPHDMRMTVEERKRYISLFVNSKSSNISDLFLWKRHKITYNLCMMKCTVVANGFENDTNIHFQRLCCLSLYDGNVHILHNVMKSNQMNCN